jgi:hypothetical protein
MENPIRISRNFLPYANLTFGYSRNNLGSAKVIYVDPAQADPLPRYARIGIGFDIGLNYESDGKSFRPVSFKWTIEANDLFVTRFPEVIDSVLDPNTQLIIPVVRQPSSWEYQNGIGDIDFMNEVIFGISNANTIKKKGWEVNVLEFISVRGGRFEEAKNRGNRRFNTIGFGLQYAGLAKIVRSLSPDFSSSGFGNFFLNHVDIAFSHSDLIADEGMSPLAGTTFNSVNVSLIY